jgi:hypothetical protein
MNHSVMELILLFIILGWILIRLLFYLSYELMKFRDIDFSQLKLVEKGSERETVGLENVESFLKHQSINP